AIELDGRHAFGACVGVAVGVAVRVAVAVGVRVGVGVWTILCLQLEQGSHAAPAIDATIASVAMIPPSARRICSSPTSLNAATNRNWTIRLSCERYLKTSADASIAGDVDEYFRDFNPGYGFFGCSLSGGLTGTAAPMNSVTGKLTPSPTPVLATHTLPAPSIAIPAGPLSPGPSKPLKLGPGEAPAGPINSVMRELPSLATQMLPAPSTATPTGAERPLPLTELNAGGSGGFGTSRLIF